VVPVPKNDQSPEGATEEVTMAGSYARLIYHLVFSTRNRQSWLTPEIAPRVSEYIGGIVTHRQGIPLAIGGAEDHVHILTILDKLDRVPDALGKIKANSCKWIHETFPHLRDFWWQEGYGAFTISVSGVERVKAYIAGQEEHHRKVTFKQEFLAFLKRHGISYDPEKIWL
jgi:REP element-mobilizing transposase RayT